MDLSTCLVLGFLLHMIGDYLLQNDWMAKHKTKSSLAALIHATLYSLPFFLVCSLDWWWLVYGSHFFIDRYRLAIYWIKLVNWNWGSTNFGFENDKPAWMAVWLMIIIDNAIHVTINSLCIFLSF